jgi:hypothetical protein
MDRLMTGKYKQFPPFVGHIKIPASTRKAALASAMLYAPGRRLSMLFHRISLVYLKLAGPGLLPGAAQDWIPPMETETWRGLLAKLEGTVGRIDEFAIYERRQKARVGFTLLLLRDASPVAFVRVNRDRHERFRREYEALALVRDARPRSFRAAAPIACGDHDAWSFLATSVLLASRHQVAAAPPVVAIAEEIRQALEPLPVPPGTPVHWQPMHGDFTPSNLRDVGSGELVLYDWEHVGWAPPGADEVMYRAAEAVLRGRDVRLGEWPEARAYWSERIAAVRSRGPEEQAWAVAMQRILNASPPEGE